MLAEQIRGARAILRMEQSELAELAGVSTPTIRRLEAMDGPVEGVRVNTIVAIKRAFQARGVVLSHDDWGPSLSIRSGSPLLETIYEELPEIFPDYNVWTWFHSGAATYDFRGERPGLDKIMFVSVRIRMEDVEEAIEDLRNSDEDAFDIERALLVMHAPYDGSTPDGIRVLAYPRPVFERDEEDMDPDG